MNAYSFVSRALPWVRWPGLVGALLALGSTAGPGFAQSVEAALERPGLAIGGSDALELAIIVRRNPPRIVTHPASQRVTVGDTVVFTVEATGDPTLTYQWRFNEQAIPRQIGATLRLTDVQVNQSGMYDVVVTNPYGSARSNPAQLTVVAVEMDFGDAPDPAFPTVLKSDGARCRLIKGFWLGRDADAEVDGQPKPDASGDGADDDGVTFLSDLIPGQTVKLNVFLTDAAGAAGRLDAWMDFNANGSWANVGEKIFDRQTLVPGDNALSFDIPATAVPGQTFARFRLSREGGYGFIGYNSDGGEVEDYALVIGRSAEFDFGDAPDGPYPTTLKSDGARHLVRSDIFMGSRIDAEVDGQPSSDALGDDGPAGAPDDEDGVVLVGTMVAGAPAVVQVTVSVAGRLDAWIDFNANGSWADKGERIFTGQAVNPGANALTFDVPPDAKIVGTFARFRYSRSGVESFVGEAKDGEVEDYRITVAEARFDFGDAPEAPYPTTLRNDGARHLVNPDFFMGARIDAESDGQPSADALGDDGPPGTPDDEDGVVFLDALKPGTLVQVQVTVSTSGRLDAWVDFNANGSWADEGERIFSGEPVSGGANTLKFDVPPGAKQTETYARFRYSRGGVKNFDGPAADGEVEDYKVTIEGEPFDFGDAPQLQSDVAAGGYPTTLSRNGARHRINPDFRLGKLIDPEPDGQPSADALGDDGSPGTPDDEDGVVFLTPVNAGSPVTIEVIASTSGRLDAWVDFNANGSWADAGERIFTGQAVSGGVNNLSFTVPAGAKQGDTFARFRYSRGGVQSFDGPATDGEVEDYRLTIGSVLLDFGDAPQLQSDLLAGGYPTTLSRNGARHGISPNYHLGKLIDGEPDGQPDPAALGDDGAVAASDDEDGVRFLTPLVAGSSAQVEVTASTSGRLDAWVDFSANGSWADAAERIFTAQPLSGGANVLTFNVPASAKAGVTFARFRFSREGNLDFTGASPIGEVEDYRVEVRPGENCNLNCRGTDFWLTFPGNYAPDPANPVKLTLCAMGDPGTQVKVEILGLGFVQTVNIPAVGAILIDLPKAADLGDSNDTIEKKGIHVTATEPVGIYGLSKVTFTSDGYLAVHTEAIGTEYIIGSYENVHAAVPELNGTQFAIVGTQNDTTVSIVPSVVTLGHDSGFPFTIKLQQGETYQLRNTEGAPQDLTGTIILSDKPISVFGGHMCANVRSPNPAFGDYLVEHLIPVIRWGVDYMAFPLATRTGDTYRVLAAFDGTLIFVNGVNVATLNRGEFYETARAFPIRILSSRPVQVFQYANSSDFDLVANADPFMLQVPHKSLYTTQNRFCVPSGFTSSYVNVIAPGALALAGLVTLDGAAIPAASFTAIAASGYSGASVFVTPGVHTVLAPQPVGVTLYGWSLYESYGWPVCFFFGDTTPPVLNCPDPITIDLGRILGTTGAVPCQAVVPDIRERVTFTDNCPRSPNIASAPNAWIVEQEPPPGTLVDPGEYEITCYVMDGRGNVGSCVTKLTVIAGPSDPNAKPVLHCPGNMTVACTSAAGAVVEFTSFATIDCKRVPLECKPPSGSVFPVGTTTVNCVLVNGAEPVTCSFTVTVTCTPTISVTLNRDRLTLTWAGDAVLQQSASIMGPWEDVPAENRFETGTTADRQRFYRLRP